MKEDARRWIDLEGPEPPFVKKLMDAGRDVALPTREEASAMRRSFMKALAEQRARHARRRRTRIALVAGAITAATAATAAAVVAVVALHDAPLGDAAASRLRYPLPAVPGAIVDAGALSSTASAGAPKPPPRSGARR